MYARVCVCVLQILEIVGKLRSLIQHVDGVQG